MKTMTCKQLGGACDLAFQAETFEGMAELSKKQDAAHLAAVQKIIAALMQDAEKMRTWFDAKRQEFEALPH